MGDSVRCAVLEIVRRHTNCLRALVEAEVLGVDGAYQLIGALPRDVTEDYLFLLFSSKDEVSALNMISVFRRLEVEGKINRTLFVSFALKFINKFEVDMLLLFSEEGILPISVFLASNVPSAFIFTSLLCLCKNGAALRVIKGFTQLVVMKGFATAATDSESDQAKNFLTELVLECYTDEDWTSSFYTPLHVLNDSRSISLDVVDYVHRHILSEILSITDTISVAEVIRTQHKFEFLSLSQSSVALFSLLGSNLSIPSLLSILETSLLHQGHGNWKWMLTCVACNIHLRPLFQDNFCTFLSEKAKTAMLNAGQDMLSNVIVLAKHSGPSQSTYRKWFEETFGGSDINKRSLQVLIETLMPLLPYEPVEYLKVHLDILSSRCERSLKVVSDYVSSIRARLLDVEDFPVENSKSAASLVEQAVDEFSTSGRILSKVTEASIFCSPFYVRCFLPLLLSHAKKDNIHGGLVEKLFKLGRMPQAMYMEYSAASSEAFSQAEFPASDHPLKVIGQVISSLSQESPVLSYQQCFDALVNLCSSIETEEYYDLTAPSLIPLQVEIVDTIVCGICQEVAGNHGSCHWLGTMIELLSQIESILWALLVRLWELLTKQINILSLAHLRGLACIAVHLVHSGSLLSKPLPLTSPAVTLRTVEQYGKLIVDSLPLRNQKYMRATFQFALFYLFFRQSLDFGGSLSKTDSIVLAMCTYVNSRYVCSKGMKGFDKLDIVQPSLSMTELTYVQWLEWELNIDPRNDFLLQHERVCYLEKCFYHFLDSMGGLGGAAPYKTVTMLFSSLLAPDLLSYNYGLGLLQNTIPALDCKCCKPALVEAVDYAMLHLASPDTDYQAITRLLCELPLENFFADVVERPRVLHDFNTSAKCLLSIQSLSNIPGVFVLPTNLTISLAKALATASAIEKLCSCSLLFHSSLLVALTESSSDFGRIDIPCGYVKNVRWLSNLSPDHAPTSLPAEVHAVCVFHLLHSNCDLTLTQYLKTATENVRAAIFDCCVRVLAGCILHPHNEQLISQVLVPIKDCLLLEPSLICCCDYDLKFSAYKHYLVQFRTNFPSPGLKSLPYAFFKIMSSVSSEIVSEWCQCRDWSLARCCIANHSMLMELQCASHLHCYQALDVNFLSTATEIAKWVIVSSSLANLTDTEQLIHWTLKYLSLKHI